MSRWHLAQQTLWPDTTQLSAWPWWDFTEEQHSQRLSEPAEFSGCKQSFTFKNSLQFSSGVVQTLPITDSIHMVFQGQLYSTFPSSSRSSGCAAAPLSPCLTFPSSKLLEEGSKKAELKQEIQFNPQLPAFVQCQKHSRNLFLQDSKTIFPHFALCCSLPVGWIGLGNHCFPHTVKRNPILQQQESSDLLTVP